MNGISIIIATYNRAEELARTLATLAAVDVPANLACETLVISNRCTDHTSQVVAKVAGTFPMPIRVVEEHRQGLSHARNRGVLAARYDIVALLDDDVNVDGNWLRALAAAHESGRHAAIGGRAPLVYPFARPQWLGDQDEGLLSKVDHGLESRPAEPDELFGVNLSFQRRAVMEAGGFRPELGRVGKILGGDEELDLLTRIIGAGGTLLYEPSVCVGHRVSASRLKRRWFWRRCFEGARITVGTMPATDVHPKAFVQSVYRCLIAVKNTAKHIGHPFSQRFFHESLRIWMQMGLSVGLLNYLLGRFPENKGNDDKGQLFAPSLPN